MTQTAPFPARPLAVQHAMVVTHHALGVVRLHRFEVQPVADAREEFGPTLADAESFVKGVCCTECGTEAAETRETAATPRTCQGCGIAGCECILREDDHAADTFWCGECQPYCGCRMCSDD